MRCRLIAEKGESVLPVLHRLQHDYPRSRSYMASASAFQILKLKHECLGITFVVIVISGIMTWNPDASIVYYFLPSPLVWRAPRLLAVTKRANSRNKAQVLRCNKTQMLKANCRQFSFKEEHYDRELSHKAGVYDHCLDVDSRMLSQNEESE